MIDGGLRALFYSHLPYFHWQSVETALTGRGVPDSNYCCDGVEGWVELKLTAGWAVLLRPEQVGWLSRRARAGGRVFVACRRQASAGPRRVAADELWLLDGAFAPDIKTLGLKKAPPSSILEVFSGGPALWDWDRVAFVLLGRRPSRGRPTSP